VPAKAPMKYLKKPIFITGLPRSGTSMIAGLLDHCGVWTGKTVGSDIKNNPKGYFENIQIREKLIKPLLSAMNCDPLGVVKLPPFPLLNKVNGLSESFERLICNEGYSGERYWLYKDAKLSLFWMPLVREFPEATWIIVRRPVADVIKSCLKTSFMRQHSDDHDFWLGFSSEYLIRLGGLMDAIPNVYEIWADSLVDGNKESMRQLLRVLNLNEQLFNENQFINHQYWSRGVLGDTSNYLKNTDKDTLTFLRHYYTNASLDISGQVAVIGSGDLLSGSRLGEEIDNHEVVIRFNLAPVGGKYKEDVGEKTSFCLLGKNITQPLTSLSPNQEKRFTQVCKHSSIICYPGHFMKIREYQNNIFHMELNVRALNNIFSQKLGNEFQPFPQQNHPRNGINLIACLVAEGIVPDVYGFDIALRKDSTHYFDDEVQHSGLGSGHKLEYEYDLLKLLAAKKLIIIR
jgi:hypothetical protein